jgi:hypothetical protein
MGRIDDFYSGFPSDWNIPRPKLVHGIDAMRVPVPSWWTDIPGMYGCNEAHRAAIGLGLSEGQETIAVFEDDCRFVPGKADIVRKFFAEVPEDWHGAMLGGQISVFDGYTTPVSQHCSKCVQVERNHAYLLSRRGMEAFYSCLCEINSIPIDHRWGDLQEAGKVNVYRCEPFVCYQADGESSISGCVEAARVWDDKIDVRLRNPDDVRIVSLVCPFPVMERLRKEGVATNGGASPPQYAVLPEGRVEQGERWISDLLLRMKHEEPGKFTNFVLQMRNDTAYHRSAVFAIWHPTEIIEFPDASQITAQTYEEVMAALV